MTDKQQPPPAVPERPLLAAIFPDGHQTIPAVGDNYKVTRVNPGALDFHDGPCTSIELARVHPVDEGRVEEIRERFQDNFRELGADEWRHQYAADVEYLLSLLPQVSSSEPDGLRQAVQTMNDLPDISGDDSPELKRLCEQSAREIKLVGCVSASISLEMVAHMRHLESLWRSKSK